jgi:hypothetical protein
MPAMFRHSRQQGSITAPAPSPGNRGKISTHAAMFRVPEVPGGKWLDRTHFACTSNLSIFQISVCPYPARTRRIRVG